MIDPPAPAWRVEDQDLCALRSLQSRPVVPGMAQLVRETGCVKALETA
jgi:hypothetical protein